jgi:putative nucleotidyltransferase with HDIG domain
MPTRRFRDLPVTTRGYIIAVVLIGSATIGESLTQLARHPIGWSWAVLALLTLISGSATVHLPALPATVSVSETFVFTSVLLFGPSAGTLTVALDALIMSLWSLRRGNAYYKAVFNIAAASSALWLAAHIYYYLSPYEPLFFSHARTISLRSLLLPLGAFTISYYAVNTGLVSFAIALERRASLLTIWKENLLWVAVNYLGGASVAALLVTYAHDLDYSVLVIIVPLLVVLYLTFSTSMGRVEDANRHLSELNSLYISTIETLAMAIDAKDQITHGHIRRVQLYAVGLARAMGVSEDSQIRAIEAAALLHDMGKLAVPEYILNKPGPLTPAEFEKMKLHASVGADILSAIDFPYPVVPIVRHHHENWNGTGYPDKLSGSDIPMGARILSVVDCFDALTSDRPYRPRLPDKEALRILQERRGTMYDPLVVDTFARVHFDIAPSMGERASGMSSLKAIAEASAAITTTSHLNVDRFEDIAASSEEMFTLFELARSLNGSMDIQDGTDLIAKHLRRLIPASTCVFYLYDENVDELVADHASGENASHIKGLRLPMGQRLSGWVAANRQTVRNSDPVLDLGESARSMIPRPRSSLSTPLLSGKRLVGVLSLYSSSKDAFSEDHQRIIEVVARQVSGQIFEVHGAGQLRAGSGNDTRSGLPNLQQLMDILGAEHAGGELHPYCMIVTRSAGETSLETPESVAAMIPALKRVLRPTDLLFRAGNGEVVALLLGTEKSSGSTVFRRLADETQTHNRAETGSPIAIGFAASPIDGVSPQEVLQVARTRSAQKPTAGFSSEPIH